MRALDSRARTDPARLGTLGGCRVFAALVLCGAWLASAPAHAQTKSALGWVRMRGAEECIGTAELASRVERLVGPVLVSASRAQVSVEARVAPVREGFEAIVVVADASGRTLGERRLHSASSDCRELDDSLVFVIAVAVDPDAALAELPGEFAGEDEPGRELLAELEAHPPGPSGWSPLRAPEEPPAPQPQVPRGPEVSLAGAAAPQLAVGLLPGVSLGLGAAFGLALGDQWLWLRTDVWLPRAEPPVGARGVSLGLTQIGLALCPLGLRDGGWDASLCAGVTAALLTAEPLGFDGRTRTAWSAGPGLELRLGRRIASPLFIGLSLRGQSLWPRRSVGYELWPNGFQAVYRRPPVAAIAALSLELRF
jgi:hypothetical protein